MASSLGFNPITGCAQPITPSEPNLQDSCRHTIIRSIGLKNLNKVSELPLPPRLQSLVGTLTLGDFHIDGTSLPPSALTTHTYPATCTLTGDTVNITRLNPGEQPADDSGVARFEEDNHWILVDIPVRSLRDIIQETRNAGTQLPQAMVWPALKALVTHLTSNQVPFTAHLSTDCIKMAAKPYIEITDKSDSEMPVDPTANATYEALEVLTQADPDSKAFVWSIGCIAYECLALEPAFYDPTGTNPFAAFQNVMTGVIPSIPTTGSAELHDLVAKCLVANKDDRISLDDLQNMLNNH